MFGERLARKLMGGYVDRSPPPRFRVRRRPQGEDPRGPRARIRLLLILAAVMTFAVVALLIPWPASIAMAVVTALLLTLAGIVFLFPKSVPRLPPRARRKRSRRSPSER